MMDNRRRKLAASCNDVVHAKKDLSSDDARLLLPERAGDADHLKSVKTGASAREVSTEMAGHDSDKHCGLEGDRLNVALLMLLYVLQGIPLGIAASVPYLLQSRHISYKEQAVFSFVFWPFSLKLLWAPLVDSVYLPAFGRRKSWLVPTQYLIGVFMFILSSSSSVDEITKPAADVVADGAEASDAAVDINITLLTGMFFMLNFLAATQDIAVDGWALTMLSKRNLGWVATCNTVGQTAGYFVGNVIFLTLESADFCNKYIYSQHETHGLVTLAGFLKFWSVTFVVVTTLVMLLKHETEAKTPDEEDVLEDTPSQSVTNAYIQLWRIVHLPAVLSLIATLMTMKIGFAAADSVTSLKLIEGGVPKENLALMAIPLVPVDMILPVLVTRYTSRHRQLDVVLRSMPFRLMLGLLFALFVWYLPIMRLSDGHFPEYFYILLFFSSAVHQIAVYCMFVPMMAFFAKVSDPVIGGTYMTLLNTVCNLGGNWPSTAALWLIDSLTWTGCTSSDGQCTSSAESCVLPSKTCTIQDGYYIESLVCFVVGFVWLFLRSSKVRRLQDLPPNSWAVSRQP